MASKVAMKELAKKTAKENQSNVLLGTNGTVSYIDASSSSCVLSWYDCNPPHIVRTVALNEGDTFFYHSWEDGVCIFRTYTCNSVSNGNLNVLPDGTKLHVEPSGDGVTITELDSDGDVLTRRCRGRCGDRTVGPIDCPDLSLIHI